VKVRKQMSKKHALRLSSDYKTVRCFGFWLKKNKWKRQHKINQNFQTCTVGESRKRGQKEESTLESMNMNIGWGIRKVIILNLLLIILCFLLIINNNNENKTKQRRNVNMNELCALVNRNCVWWLELEGQAHL
jgi:hypothetical protein